LIPARTASRRARRGLALPLLAAAGLSACHAREAAPNCRDCNVILISIDTLRANHLHAYGYARETSPFIDRLAGESMLFEQVVDTGGGTLPVHASMFSSLPPTEHGVWAESGRSLDADRVTLAELLQAAGYETRAYTGGGFVRAVFGLAQGFSTFDDAGGNFAVELPKLDHWLRVERSKDKKFFLFLHTYDVHSAEKGLPYDPPAAFRDAFTGDRRGAFDGCRWQLCASEMLKHYTTR
jgi:arylsulfatase A-like enzyme